MLTDPESHEADGEDGCSGHDGGSHACNKPAWRRGSEGECEVWWGASGVWVVLTQSGLSCVRCYLIQQFYQFGDHITGRHPATLSHSLDNQCSRCRSLYYNYLELLSAGTGDIHLMPELVSRLQTSIQPRHGEQSPCRLGEGEDINCWGRGEEVIERRHEEASTAALSEPSTIGMCLR